MNLRVFFQLSFLYRLGRLVSWLYSACLLGLYVFRNFHAKILQLYFIARYFPDKVLIIFEGRKFSEYLPCELLWIDTDYSFEVPLVTAIFLNKKQTTSC